MKSVKFITIWTVVTALLLLPGWSFAQDEEEGVVSGSVSIGAKAVSGDRESQKFQEYREIPRGVSGNVEIQYKTNDKFFIELDAKNISQDDQKLNVKTGKYGQYSLEFVYDQIPHRFALDAKTLFSGGGSGSLLISDYDQTLLQYATINDLNVDGFKDADTDKNGTVSATEANLEVANRIKDLMNAAKVTDIQLFRRKTSLKLDVSSFSSVNWSLEWINEKRKGTRPIAASFGFGNTIEIPEPIDYDTNQLKLGAEFAKNSLYLNVGAYVSVFKNNIDTVTWDNPFRITDSTAANAYSASYASGASKGLHDLYPDNKYSNLSLTGSLMNMPMNGRISLSAAWGWMQQDDPFVAYTTNTAITTGAVTGEAGTTVPFNAFDKANLPKSSADAKVSTSLLNLSYTAHPSENLNLKAKYRVYKYDNKTAEIDFPGYVRGDGVWEPVEEEATGSSYKKTTAGIDLGFSVSKATSVSLGYTLDTMQRSHTREVAKSNEKIYNVSLLSKITDWLDIKTSYENSTRTGDYDYQAPHKDGIEADLAAGTSPAMLPFTRKYDEANRKRNRLQFMATLYPSESFTLSGMVVVGKDDFMDSPFGLLEDKHSIYSLDADVAVTEKVDFYAYYTRENYKSLQKSRQWNPCNPTSAAEAAGTATPGCTGANEGSDPYWVVTGYDSPSNWTSENEDKVDTFGGGVKVKVKPEKVDFDLNYAYSKSDGKIALESPLGASTTVDSNMVTPVSFNDVDDITTQTLKAKVNYTLKKNVSLIFGYMWENFDVRDYNLVGFTTTPVNATGAYQGTLLMDSLLKNYDVHVVSAGISVKF